VLRQLGGAIGLAIASSTAIMVYVMLLGWLQRRRFEKEAAARGTTLQGDQEMLRPVLRLAAAAAIATGLGLLARAQLLYWLPDMHIVTILLRATLLCMFGIGAYLALARLFSAADVIELEVKLFHKAQVG
jgi:putative peptidoglycan lipid II flippase